MRKPKILSFLLIFIVISCSQNSLLKEKYDPELPIPIEEMNKEFLIFNLPVFQNSLINNELLALKARNNLPVEIIFPGDFNTRIYFKNDDVWELAINNIGSSEYEWVLPTNDEFPGGLLVDLIPYIADLDKPASIRVFITGKINGTNKNVGAYTDLVLIP